MVSVIGTNALTGVLETLIQSGDQTQKVRWLLMVKSLPGTMTDSGYSQKDATYAGAGPAVNTRVAWVVVGSSRHSRTEARPVIFSTSLKIA